jgi:hypothetical protein
VNRKQAQRVERLLNFFRQLPLRFFSCARESGPALTGSRKRVAHPVHRFRQALCRRQQRLQLSTPFERESAAIAISCGAGAWRRVYGRGALWHTWKSEENCVAKRKAVSACVHENVLYTWRTETYGIMQEKSVIPQLQRYRLTFVAFRTRRECRLSALA